MSTKEQTELEILLQEEARYDQEREKLRIQAIWALRMIHRQESVFHQQSQSPYHICEGRPGDSEPPEYPFFEGSIFPQGFEAIRSVFDSVAWLSFVENPAVPEEHRYTPKGRYIIGSLRPYPASLQKKKERLNPSKYTDEYVAQLKQVAYPSNK